MIYSFILTGDDDDDEFSSSVFVSVSMLQFELPIFTQRSISEIHTDTTSSPAHHLLTPVIRAGNMNKKMSNENIENPNILNYKYFVLSFLHIMV